jgi:hypothetical protein
MCPYGPIYWIVISDSFQFVLIPDYMFPIISLANGGSGHSAQFVDVFCNSGFIRSHDHRDRSRL